MRIFSRSGETHHLEKPGASDGAKYQHPKSTTPLRLGPMAILSTFLAGTVAAVGGITSTTTAASATTTTVYVNNGRITGTADTSCATAIYSTIQAAIDATSPGGKVHVCSGTYPEQVKIEKSITLIGDPGRGVVGPGPNAPVLDGANLTGAPDFSGDSSGCVAFDLAGGVTNVKISGFSIEHYRCGTVVTGNEGISAWNDTRGTSKIKITHNSFSDILWAAVLVGSDHSVQHSDWTVSQNVVTIGKWAPNNNVYGIELTNTKDSTISNNIVSGGYQGILTQPRGTSEDIVISGNTVGSDANAGIQIAPYGSATAKDIHVIANIIDSGATGIHVGGVGIVKGIDIHLNSLGGNVISGIANDSSATVDATHNWWGSSSGPGPIGPGTGVPVSAHVDYSHWCVKSSCVPRSTREHHRPMEIG